MGRQVGRHGHAFRGAVGGRADAALGVSARRCAWRQLCAVEGIDAPMSGHSGGWSGPSGPAPLGALRGRAGAAQGGRVGGCSWRGGKRKFFCARDRTESRERVSCLPPCSLKQSRDMSSECLASFLHTGQVLCVESESPASLPSQHLLLSPPCPLVRVASVLWGCACGNVMVGASSREQISRSPPQKQKSCFPCQKQLSCLPPPKRDQKGHLSSGRLSRLALGAHPLPSGSTREACPETEGHPASLLCPRNRTRN